MNVPQVDRFGSGFETCGTFKVLSRYPFQLTVAKGLSLLAMFAISFATFARIAMSVISNSMYNWDSDIVCLLY
jgi:hypothetical protein